MKRLLIRLLVFLGFPIVPGVASDQLRDPMREIDQYLSPAQPSTRDIGFAVDRLVEHVGWMAEIKNPKIPAKFREAIIQAELETRQGRRPRIEESTVAAVYASVMREMQAPAWAGVTVEEVHKLHKGLSILFPHMAAMDHDVVSGAVQASIVRSGALQFGALQPIEALYILCWVGSHGRLIESKTQPPALNKGAARSSEVRVEFRQLNSNEQGYVDFRRRYLESQSTRALWSLTARTLNALNIPI